MKTFVSIMFFILTTISMKGQETYVFFGSFNWNKESEGIYIYKLDTAHGKLKKITSYKGVRNPSFLTLSSDGKFLYACTDSKTPNEGSVSSFKFDVQNRTLTFINSQKSGGENPVYVSVHNSGKWLVCANYTVSGLGIFPISDSGEIFPAVQNPTFNEGSGASERQQVSHLHAAVFSPDGNTLFLPDLGADNIVTYPFNPLDTLPLLIKNQMNISTKPGSGPRHFTFHPNGNWAYCIEELSGAISVFEAKQNQLTCIQNIATHVEDLNVNFESSDIHISPDGKFLYASNRGVENNIAIFRIQENGTLTIVGYSPTFGQHPRVFTIDDSGKFIIVTNVNTGNAIVFHRDVNSGLLKKAGKGIKIKNATCVITKQY